MYYCYMVTGLYFELVELANPILNRTARQPVHSVTTKMLLTVVLEVLCNFCPHRNDQNNAKQIESVLLTDFHLLYCLLVILCTEHRYPPIDDKMHLM